MHTICKNDTAQHLPDKIIDFHVHLFPNKGFDAIRKVFKTVYGAEIPYNLYYEECIDYLQQRNVTPIVFSNYAHKKGIAETMNQWNIDLLDRIPELYCFAAYHPDDSNALEYAEKMMTHPRVMGIKMHLEVQRFYPYDDRLIPLYEMIIDKKKRVLLHTGNGPVGNEFVGFKHFIKLLHRFPNLPVNIPHMGGLEFKEFIELLDDHPGIYLDTAYSFWPNLPFTFNLDTSYLEKYKDNILYGSDFPNTILPRKGEIEYLLSLNLSKAFYHKVFYENGIKLLNQTCPEAQKRHCP